MKKPPLLFLFFLTFALLSFPVLARDKEGHFIVVIDPGHGGHDGGAKGRKSKEKDIVLSVAKKVGNKIKALNPDITVYYTRSSDRFIGLDQRADFAIDKHADLFVSIHANSTKGTSAYGAETYVLGLHRSRENLEVAMKENSVILLEDDYSMKYEDFDPNSSESYIIFQFMQNKHLDASINLARKIQKGFAKSGRKDRGVRQAGFLVLRKAAMPSVLVELGFISNPSEEDYLNSSSGQNELASGIAASVVAYEKAVAQKNGNFTPTQSGGKTAKVSEPKTSGKPASYRIQVLADKVVLPKSHTLYKKYGAGEVRYYREGSYYKYTLYDTSDLKEAHRLQRELQKTYKDCFVVGFDGDGNKVGSYY